MSGCESKFVLNRQVVNQAVTLICGRSIARLLFRYCHGACTSLYIPQSRAKKLKASFKSCSACVPVQTEVINVFLNCPDRDEKRVQRRIVRVTRCECRNVQIDDPEDDDTTATRARSSNNGGGGGSSSSSRRRRRQHRLA